MNFNRITAETEFPVEQRSGTYVELLQVNLGKKSFYWENECQGLKPTYCSIIFCRPLGYIVPLVSRRPESEGDQEINRYPDFAGEDSIQVLVIERYHEAERHNMRNKHPSQTFH